MILGQSAATAACLAIDDGVSVQQLDYARLRKRLDADGQALEIPPGSVSKRGLDPAQLAGIVVDDVDAIKIGTWHSSASIGGFVGSTYLHDNNDGQGNKSVRFPIAVPEAGRYEVRLAYTASSNRASNVPVSIFHAGGQSQQTVNQRRRPPIDGAFFSLGTFSFDPRGDSAVTIETTGTDGHVIADAVQLLPESNQQAVE